MSQPRTSEPPSKGSVRTSDNQLFCCKSIDKLISEAEDPERKLKKTLGPWSLTALGIGAIIGSGIFVAYWHRSGRRIFPGTFHSARASARYHRELPAGWWNRAGSDARAPAGWSFDCHFIFSGGRSLQFCRTVLRGTGVDDSHRRQRLHLLLRDAGRNLRVDHRLGPHSRIRRQQLVVAIGFSAYTKAQLSSFGMNLPDRWSTPVWESGHWTGAYFNVPAFLIIFILTVLLVRGIKESAEANNIMVLIKISAIVIFLVVGGALVNSGNWKPFAPSGFGGIVTGGAIVFFTYIGFDSVSTAAEEARNPQRDLPIGIIASLIVCTLLYVGVSIVLLGMMKYTTFISGDAAQAPVAYALKALGASRWSRSIIVIGALTGMISSLLVFQYGQARIWYAMSRDRLFPRLFSAVHTKFQTPHVSTWIAGFVVGIPSGIFAISDAADLSNIGTLFAFVLVSLGVIILRRTQPDRPRVFKVPLVPWFPLISIVLCGGLMTGLTVITWVRFIVWLVLGLLIYIFYSRHRSEFAQK